MVLATVARRGSDRVSAKTSAVLADGGKDTTSESVRQTSTTPPIANRSDRDLFSSMHHPSCCQTGTSHDDPDQFGFDGGLGCDDRDWTGQVGRHPQATETMATLRPPCTLFLTAIQLSKATQDRQKRARTQEDGLSCLKWACGLRRHNTRRVGSFCLRIRHVRHGARRWSPLWPGTRE